MVCKTTVVHFHNLGLHAVTIPAFVSPVKETKMLYVTAFSFGTSPLANASVKTDSRAGGS